MRHSDQVYNSFEPISIEKLARAFGVSYERAKQAQDDLGLMYRELASPGTSTVLANNSKSGG